MKILLVTIGSHGDVHPFIGIGLALQRRGHDVVLATNGHFSTLVGNAGLEFVELGTDEQFRGMIQDPDLFDEHKGFHAVFGKGALPLVEPTYEIIRQHQLSGTSVVVAHCLALGALVAHEKLGIPTATALTAPAIMRTVYDVPKLPILTLPSWYPKWFKSLLWYIGDRFIVDPVVAPTINEFRARLGLTPPLKRILKDWWHPPQLVMGLWPEWYAPAQPDWPPQFHAVGFPLFDETGITPIAAELDQWLSAGEAPIAFTPGSAMIHGAEFFQESAAACAILKRRGLLLTRHAEQISSQLPPGVRHVHYAPFGELLPRCAALVHHGGIGTTAQALRSGCPQLIMPMAHDQFDNAHRLTKLGVGGSIPLKKYRSQNVAEALRPLVQTPNVREKCREVARQFEGFAPLELCADLVEKLGSSQVPENAVIRNY